MRALTPLDAEHQGISRTESSRNALKKRHQRDHQRILSQRSSRDQRVALPANCDTWVSNTRQPSPAKTAHANGLVQNPSEPAQLRGSISPHGPTAHSRDHIVAAAYAYDRSSYARSDRGGTRHDL